MKKKEKQKKLANSGSFSIALECQVENGKGKDYV